MGLSIEILLVLPQQSRFRADIPTVHFFWLCVELSLDLFELIVPSFAVRRFFRFVSNMIKYKVVCSQGIEFLGCYMLRKGDLEDISRTAWLLLSYFHSFFDVDQKLSDCASLHTVYFRFHHSEDEPVSCCIAVSRFWILDVKFSQVLLETCSSGRLFGNVLLHKVR